MAKNYQEELKEKAQRFYSLCTEYDRAREERDEAVERFDKLASQRREVEEELCASVGNNIQKRLFQVDSGRFVLVRFVNATFKCCEVLELEPTE